VTENGALNLEGLSSMESALRLIKLAHPEFREGLMASAKESNLDDHGLLDCGRTLRIAVTFLLGFVGA
jgi:acyl-CoA hydrolase